MKKISALLLVLLLSVFVPLCALADTSQVVNEGGTVFFNAAGEPVNVDELGEGGAIVEMKKTISDVADKENEFEITLQVRTTQDLKVLQNPSPDAAVTLILDISSSMYKDCVKCGHESYESCHTGKNPKCVFEDRLTHTVDAAKAFVTNFSTFKTDANATTTPKRYVGIVAFNKTANTITKNDGYYIDVATASGLNKVNSLLESLKVTTGSGTNIEGGLLLGRNLEYAYFTEGKTLSHIKYLYTVLLTDGEPFQGASGKNLTSINTIEGSSGSSEATRVDTVGTQAADIKALSPLAKLYSIVLGVEKSDSHTGSSNSTLDIVFNYNATSAIPPIYKGVTTVGSWLSQFCDEVYGDSEEASADSILDNFNTVFSQMQLAAQAWEVTDEMGPYIDYAGSSEVADGNKVSFSGSNDTLTWNLLSSSADSTISNEAAKILGYTYKYKVKLDNLNTNYSAGSPTPSNTKAVLDYAVHNSQTNEWTLINDKEFAQPSVRGFGNQMIDFKKVLQSSDGKYSPLSGITFQLYVDGGLEPFKTFTSTADGTVKFENLPSGHSYLIKEVPHAHYSNLNDITFDVAYGQIENLNNTLLEHDNDLIAVNKIVPHENNQINLVINKVFKIRYQSDTSSAPVDYDVPEGVINSVGATASFEISHADSSATAAAHADRTFTLYHNSDGERLSNSLLGIDDHLHQITETNASIPGFDWLQNETTITVEEYRGTSETPAAKDSLTNTAVSVDPDRATDTKKTYVVTFTNYFEPKSGSITVNKSFGHHGNQTCDNSAFNGVEVDIQLYDASGTLLLTRRTVNGTVTFNNIPLGTYLLKEVNPGDIGTDHVWEGARFVTLTKNGTTQNLDVEAVQNGQSVKIEADGDAFTLGLENHYVHRSARIEINKAFSFSDLPAGKTAAQHFADLYQAAGLTGDPQIIFTLTKQGDADFAPVTLILSEDSGWAAVSAPLPIGTYTVTETAVGLPGYAHTAYTGSIELKAGDHGKVIYTLVTNEYTRKTGSLTISKVFAQADQKKHFEDNNRSIAVYVRHADGSLYRKVLLNKGNNWTVTLYNVPQGEYELAEEIAKGDPDTAFRDHHALTASWGKAGYDISYADWASDSISRTVTNSYKEHNHDINVQKAYTIDGNSSDAAGNAYPLPQGYSVTVRLTKVDQNNQPISGEEYRQSALSGAPLSHTFALPMGRYLVEEFVSGEDPDYKFVSNHFALSNASDHVSLTELGNGKALLVVDALSGAEHAPASISVTNDYTLKKAKIAVEKSFTGQLTEDLFKQTQFNVQIYDNNNTPDNLTDDGDPVDTLVLNQENGFFDESNELDPTKTYRLVEAHSEITNYTYKPVWYRGNDVISTAETVYGVSLAPGETAQITLVNHYEREITAHDAITVQKLYSINGMSADETAAAVANKSVVVTFKTVNKQIGQDDSYTFVLQGTHPQTISLPVGQYDVYESSVPEIEDYTFNPGGTHVVIEQKNGDIELNDREFDGDFTTAQADTRLTVDDNSNIKIFITNPYTPNDGSITLTKVFDGYANLPEKVDFLFKNDTTGKEYPVTLRGTSSPAWTGSLKLPTGTYTVQELSLNDAQVITTWTSNALNAEGKLVVEAGATITITCTNTLKKARIAVEKTFSGYLTEDDFKEKEFRVEIRSGEELVETLSLNDGNSFSAASGDLDATKTYRLVETGHEVDNYTHTAVWGSNGTAISDGTTFANLVLTPGETASFTLDNSYIPNNGTLQLSKQFVGYSDLPESVSFVFTDVADASKTYTFALKEENADPNNEHTWTDSISLPVGTYTVEEEIEDTITASERVVTTWTGLNENDQFVVAPGASLSLTCVNRLDSTLIAQVPFKKLIKLGGSVPCAPGLKLRFEVDVIKPDSTMIHAAGVSGASSLTFKKVGETGEVEHYIMDIVLNNGEAMEGYLEISDFGDENGLASVKLTIRESLHPYENAEQAMLAGWKYDAKSYAANFEGTTLTEVKMDLHDDAGKAAAAASFTNTYTVNIPEDIPETGDNSRLPLWTLLLAVCGMALMRMKRKAA